MTRVHQLFELFKGYVHIQIVEVIFLLLLLYYVIYCIFYFIGDICQEGTNKIMLASVQR